MIYDLTNSTHVSMLKYDHICNMKYGLEYCFFRGVFKKSKRNQKIENNLRMFCPIDRMDWTELAYKAIYSRNYIVLKYINSLGIVLNVYETVKICLLEDDDSCDEGNFDEDNCDDENCEELDYFELMESRRYKYKSRAEYVFYEELDRINSFVLLPIYGIALMSAKTRVSKNCAVSKLPVELVREVLMYL